MGGSSDSGIYMFSLCTGMFLYFLISWPFWMGSHWWHWTAKNSLCALAVSNGGGSIVRFTPWGYIWKFELISSFDLASQSSFVSYKKQKTNNTANCSFEWYHFKWMKKLEPPVGIKPDTSWLPVKHPNQ